MLTDYKISRIKCKENRTEIFVRFYKGAVKEMDERTANKIEKITRYRRSELLREETFVFDGINDKEIRLLMNKELAKDNNKPINEQTVVIVA